MVVGWPAAVVLLGDGAVWEALVFCGRRTEQNANAVCPVAGTGATCFKELQDSSCRKKLKLGP